MLSIENNGYYANDILCILQAHDNYKIADISVWLDGKLLINKFKVNSSSCEHPFTIATKTLSNGAHSLKAEVVNALYNQKKAIKDTTFFVDNNPLQAACIRPESENKVFQGRTLHIQFQVNKEIKSAQIHALSNSYPAFAEAKNSPIYESFIPITCEEIPNEYLLTVDIVDHVGNSLILEAKFQVVAFQFKKNNLHVIQKSSRRKRSRTCSSIARSRH